MKNFIAEFKAFAMKGNVMDLAVAVVIGAAFGKIVSSLVDNIIMPVLGIFMGGIEMSGLTYTIGGAVISYGTFLQAVVDFLIIALSIFLAVKAINRAQEVWDGEVEVTKEDEPKKPSEEVELLREIRDSLQR